MEAMEFKESPTHGRLLILDYHPEFSRFLQEKR